MNCSEKNMNPIKLIFLDIDGVLVTGKHLSVLHHAGKKNSQVFDPECVLFFNDLISKTQAKIVISSTWRKIHSLDWIKEHFKSQGFLFSDSIIGMTKKEHKDRGLQILEWLDENKELLLNYEGYSYIVIDDDTQDIVPHIQSHLFINPSFVNGFQEEHLKQALDIPFFGRKYDPTRD